MSNNFGDYLVMGNYGIGGGGGGGSMGMAQQASFQESQDKQAYLQQFLAQQQATAKTQPVPDRRVILLCEEQ